jgi:hypothetical protein
VWVTDRLYSISGVRIQIRSTTPRLAERAHALFAPFFLSGDDPAASDVCYSLIGRKEPVRKGQHSYVFLYKETGRLARTLSEAALLAELFDQIVGVVPRLVPDAYAIAAGMVICDGAGVVLAGAEPAETRRMVAAFCAHGYAYASSTLLLAGTASRTWAPCPFPLVARDAEEAHTYARAGLALPAEALAQDPELIFPLIVGSPTRDVDMPSLLPRVRALLVAGAAPPDEAPAIVPLGKARAVLRLLALSANYRERQEERLSLLRDLVAGSTSFEMRVPALDAGIEHSVALARPAMEQALA